MRILILASCMWPLALNAQHKADTLTSELNTVEVAGRQATSTLGLRADGSYKIDVRTLDFLPKIMGNADPVHYAQMLPGVTTSSETDTGLHIQGSDNTHNLLSAGGVPIYNAAHLLGFFSTFNASHYSTLTLKKGANEASDASRLGGTLTMDLPTQPVDTLNGELAVGLLSSQGTLRIPVGKRQGLILSGRASYINLLYSQWLNMDDIRLHYRFYDLNATYIAALNDRHTLWVDAYHGRDRVNMGDGVYQADFKMRWENSLGALHWAYDNHNGMKARTSAFYTRYANKWDMVVSNSHYTMPSDIGTLGLRSEVETHGLKAGAELAWHQIQPQSVLADVSFNNKHHLTEKQRTQEYTLYAQYGRKLCGAFSFKAGLRANAYIDPDGETRLSADPSASLTYRKGNLELTADYAVRHQYLYQTGTYSLGMPSEFWNSVNSVCPPQWAHGPTLSACLYLLDDRYRLSADAYYKRMHNQVEYEGDLLQLLNSDTQVSDHFIVGNGFNSGFSLTITKLKGAVTGWVSYAYSRARRRFDIEGYKDGYYAAQHERPHELNAVVAWQLNDRWNLSATYTLASGTPFTAPSHFYLLNGMVVAQYGEHNAARLSPYNRLDLSANYNFRQRRKHVRSGMNFSLYNATFSHNDISCRLRVHNGKYFYYHFKLIKFALPSVSYYLKF